MAGVTTGVVPAAAHFLHPQHELKLRQQYHLKRSCDLCGEKLTGSGYSCQWRLCDFNLHEDCAGYPETLPSFFAHPWHDLTLSRTTTDDDDNGGRSIVVACELCREEIVVPGVFLYRCVPCGFAVHPRCSRLPQTASSELHSDHSLTVLPRAGMCAACREPCGVWVYRCGLCDVDLHIECLHGARASTNSTTTGCGCGGSSKEKEKQSSLLDNKVMGGIAEGTIGLVGQSLMDMFLNE